jgi:division protein CdvB (Snf7/Vps24/ESCRT-III family)
VARLHTSKAQMNSVVMQMQNQLPPPPFSILSSSHPPLSILRSRKAVARLHTSKAQMNSVVMQMQNQLSQQKLMGTLSKSSDIMKAMNRLVKVSAHRLVA